MIRAGRMAAIATALSIGVASLAVSAWGADPSPQSQPSGGAAPLVPVGFSGRVQFQGQDCGQGATREVVGGVEQLRDFRCDLWMGTTDPRFTGTFVTIGNVDTYRTGEFVEPSGPFNVSTFVHRVENDQGAWQGVTTTAYVDPTGDAAAFPLPTETLVFRGEGGYEGLTAVVWRSAQHVRGVIFAGDPPRCHLGWTRATTADRRPPR